MANQITVIDLVKDEFDCEEPESYQDTVAKLEEKVSQMKQEIDSMKEIIVDHKSLFVGDSKAYLLPQTAVFSTFDLIFPTFLNHALVFPKKAFNNLTAMRKDEKNGGRYFIVETIRFLL